MRSIGLILCLWYFLNCATYWKNRKNDLKDIVTVGAETPMYGAAVKVGPLPIGIVFQGGESSLGKRDLGRGVGIRGGEIGGDIPNLVSIRAGGTHPFLRFTHFGCGNHFHCLGDLFRIFYALDLATYLFAYCHESLLLLLFKRL